MKIITTLVTLCAILFSLCFPAVAQQPTKVPRIGYLTGASLSANSARHEAFRQGLRQLGYVEGKNIVIEWRSAEEKLDRLRDGWFVTNPCRQGSNGDDSYRDGTGFRSCW